MKKIENFIYGMIKKNKKIKNFVRNIYQLIHAPIGFTKGSKFGKLKLVRKYDNSFFGFHDRASLNSSGSLISHYQYKMNPDGIGTSMIKVKSIYNDNVLFEVKTNCCNYQQGSLATWMDDEHIIFNDFLTVPVARIINIHTSSESRLPFHFYSISDNLEFVTSISFARYGQGLIGYGYNVSYSDDYIEDAKCNKGKTELSDFVVYNRFHDKEVVRISIYQAIQLSEGLIDKGYYYFSHSNFSPDSSKVYFLLRSSNENYNSSQLFVYDITLSKLFALPTSGMVSHLSWLDSNTIVAYCNTKENTSDGYYVFDSKHEWETSCRVAPEVKVDGHPHAISATKFITDTYPDKYRHQHLSVISTDNRSIVDLASIYSPLKFKDNVRVDLHPRLSKCKRYLTIDSSFEGKRSQLVIDFDKELIL